MNFLLYKLGIMDHATNDEILKRVGADRKLRNMIKTIS